MSEIEKQCEAKRVEIMKSFVKDVSTNLAGCVGKLDASTVGCMVEGLDSAASKLEASATKFEKECSEHVKQL